MKGMGKREKETWKFIRKTNDILRPRPCHKKDCKNYNNRFSIVVSGLDESETTFVLTEKYLICLHCKHYLRDLNLYEKKEVK